MVNQSKYMNICDQVTQTLKVTVANSNVDLTGMVNGNLGMSSPPFGKLSCSRREPDESKSLRRPYLVSEYELVRTRDMEGME